MKKIFILTVMFSLLLVSCTNTPDDWYFKKECSEIDEIKIVHVDVECYRDFEKYQVLNEIDISLAEELCADIENIDVKRYFFNRQETSGNCFLIVYTNGEYDLISAVEPMHFIYDGDDNILRPSGSTWLKFDKEQFDSLIDKYLNMDESTEN